jgi:dTMP kinase
MKARERFITLEGGEGAGKSSLMKRLVLQLKETGLPLFATRSPGSLDLGARIRDLLLQSDADEMIPKTELFLFLADRALHVAQELRPALRAGKIVLCDRYNDSTIVYQGITRGLGRLRVERFCRFACDGLEPGLTLYLDLDPVIGLQRRGYVSRSDRIESETLEFHRVVRSGYLEMARRDPERIQVIDAGQNEEDVFLKASHLIRDFLASCTQ